MASGHGTHHLIKLDKTQKHDPLIHPTCADKPSHVDDCLEHHDAAWPFKAPPFQTFWRLRKIREWNPVGPH